jgi:hypothetical protein
MSRKTYLLFFILLLLTNSYALNPSLIDASIDSINLISRQSSPCSVTVYDTLDSSITCLPDTCFWSYKIDSTSQVTNCNQRFLWQADISFAVLDPNNDTISMTGSNVYWYLSHCCPGINYVDYSKPQADSIWGDIITMSGTHKKLHMRFGTIGLSDSQIHYEFAICLCLAGSTYGAGCKQFNYWLTDLPKTEAAYSKKHKRLSAYLNGKNWTYNSNNVIFFNEEKRDIKIELFTVNGKLIFSKLSSTNPIVIPVPQINNQVLFARALNGNKIVSTKSLLVK